MDCRTDSRWANRFRGDCVSIDYEPRPRWLRTSIDERSVKFVADVLEDHRPSYEVLEPRKFQQRQYSVFSVMISRRDKFLRDGFLTAWLQNRSRSAWILQPCWREDSTFRTKYSCVELSLLAKRGLGTLSHGRLARWQSEEPVTLEMRKKGWRNSCDVVEATEGLKNELWRRMSCDEGKATEGLENELWPRWSNGKVGEWALFILQPFRTSPTAQLILQPFRRFTYVIAHSPSLPLLHLRHSSFSNPSFASPTSQTQR